VRRIHQRFRQHSQPLQPQEEVPWKKAIHCERNHVERFFNMLKQFRRIAARKPQDYAIRNRLAEP
jgi:transposase